MSELSREQVEERIKWYGENFVLYRTRWANELLDTDAALRATITQQAQELDRVKGELAEAREISTWYGQLVKRASIGTKATPSLRAYIEQTEAKLAARDLSLEGSRAEVAALEQQLSAMTRERDAAQFMAKRGVETLEKQVQQTNEARQQLAASQARCREMEDDVWKAHVPCTGTQHDPSNGLLHGYCVRCRQVWPCEYSPERHQAQLQATLAARVTEVGELNVKLRDAVQEAGRLREALEKIAGDNILAIINAIIGSGQHYHRPAIHVDILREAYQALNKPQSRGGSGGAANRGA